MKTIVLSLFIALPLFSMDCDYILRYDSTNIKELGNHKVINAIKDILKDKNYNYISSSIDEAIPDTSAIFSIGIHAPTRHIGLAKAQIDVFSSNNRNGINVSHKSYLQHYPWKNKAKLLIKAVKALPRCQKIYSIYKL